METERQFFEGRKYVIYSHNLNTLTKAPIGVVTAFPGYPTPKFNSYHSLKSLPALHMI